MSTVEAIALGVTLYFAGFVSGIAFGLVLLFRKLRIAELDEYYRIKAEDDWAAEDDYAPYPAVEHDYFGEDYL